MKLSAFQITRYLFLFTVVVLVVFGIGSLFVSYPIYAVAMFGDVAVMAFCAWQLSRRTKFIFYFSVFVLVLNIIPTIFDQFGLVDLFFVLLNIATLISLVSARKEFLPT
jgi:hypothetical protein